MKAEEAGDGSGLRNKIVAALEAAYDQKETNVGAQVMRYIEKEMMLRTLDQHWREHLAAMDYMRQGIFLRSYAQKNPKQEYKREAFELFSAMLDRIKFDTVTTVSKIQVRSQAEIEREELERQQRLARALQAQHAEAISPIQALPALQATRRRRCRAIPAAMSWKWIRARAAARGAFRAADAQGGAQRTLSLRVRPQVQALPRHAAASERLSANPRPVVHVVAAALIDAAGRVLIAQRPAGQTPGGRVGISRRETRTRRGTRGGTRARAA